jgi:Zn-dependent peptidase ImmA (M78 family)
LEPRYKLVRMRARNFHKDLVCPPVPVYEIARSVARIVFVNDPVIKDAVCFYMHEHKDPCILVNMYVNKARIHFSVAHEVAHIVLEHFEVLESYTRKHGVPIRDKLFFWSDIPQVKRLLKVLEREAEIFAAELLMPVKWLYRPKNKTDFENLRDSLEVSNQALIYRLDETGIISRNVVNKILNVQPVGAGTPW